MLSRTVTKVMTTGNSVRGMSGVSSLSGNAQIVTVPFNNELQNIRWIRSESIQKRFLSSNAIEQETVIEDDIPFPDSDHKPEGFELIAHSPPRGKLPRGALVGSVVSTKMQKTVNVAVDRYKILPKYRKRMKYTRKFMAHDEIEECNEGDVVLITPCRKMSKNKHFEVAQIMRKKGTL